MCESLFENGLSHSSRVSKNHWPARSCGQSEVQRCGEGWCGVVWGCQRTASSAVKLQSALNAGGCPLPATCSAGRMVVG